MFVRGVTTVTKFGFFAAFAASALATSARAEDLPASIESPVVFLPSDVASGERRVSENDTFIDVPLRWALAGKLGQDVAVVTASGTYTLRAGEVLPQLLIPVNGRIDGGRILLCSRNKVVEKRKGEEPITGLVAAISDSLRDAQYCVEDTDKDGRADRALVLGKGSKELPAGPIAPTEVVLLNNEVIPGGEDKLTVGLIQVSKNTTTLWLNIIQRGKRRNFDTMVSGRWTAKGMPVFRHTSGFPITVNVLGVEISLLAAAHKENAATFSWKAVAPPGEAVVIPRVRNITYSF